jgi:hypothetical protein
VSHWSAGRGNLAAAAMREPDHEFSAVRRSGCDRRVVEPDVVGDIVGAAGRLGRSPAAGDHAGPQVADPDRHLVADGADPGAAPAEDRRVPAGVAAGRLVDRRAGHGELRVPIGGDALRGGGIPFIVLHDVGATIDRCLGPSRLTAQPGGGWLRSDLGGGLRHGTLGGGGAGKERPVRGEAAEQDHERDHDDPCRAVRSAHSDADPGKLALRSSRWTLTTTTSYGWRPERPWTVRW